MSDNAINAYVSIIEAYIAATNTLTPKEREEVAHAMRIFAGGMEVQEGEMAKS